jgi:hypothetical protein
VDFKFAVDNFDGEGWVIQKLELYCNVQDCPYKVKGELHPLNRDYDGCRCNECPTKPSNEPTLVFYEAFPFWNKYQEPVKGVDWNSKQSSYFDYWSVGKNLWKNKRTGDERCGAFRIRATAKFYSLQQLLVPNREDFGYDIEDWGFKYKRELSAPEKCFEGALSWDKPGMPIFTEREPPMWLWPSTGEAAEMDFQISFNCCKWCKRYSEIQWSGELNRPRRKELPITTE